MTARRPTPNRDREPYDETFWRDFLTRGDQRERYLRRFLRHVPASPRCRLCAAPFRGIGAPLMRALGKGPSTVSPTMCDACNTFLSQHHGGAEVTMSLLFADVRGSTGLAESMSPSAFRALMDRFYSTASAVVFENEGLVDKFVGDELVAAFTPLFSGEGHARQAVQAARALLRATGHEDPGGPWVPLGAGVTSGVVWFGAVGEGSHVELTALGDEVNVAARLATEAAAGEILVTASAATAAGAAGEVLDDADRRQLALKGKQATTEVIALRVGPA